MRNLTENTIVIAILLGPVVLGVGLALWTGNPGWLGLCAFTLVLGLAG